MDAVWEEAEGCAWILLGEDYITCLGNFRPMCGYTSRIIMSNY